LNEYEFELAFTDGQVGLLVVVEMAFIAVGIVVREEDRAAGERRHFLSLRLAERRGLILGVLRGFRLTRLRGGAGAELGVGAVGG
jgi:hypothetical protein